MKELISFVFSLFFVFIITLIISLFLTGCTYSINMVHTEGSASDVVDETQTSDPTISPTLKIPVKL